jgi:hypothetical protein
MRSYLTIIFILSIGLIYGQDTTKTKNLFVLNIINPGFAYEYSISDNCNYEKTYIRNVLEEVIDLEKPFFKKQNIKILLSPIGLAKGHEDDTLLKRLAELNPDFIYYHPKSLYETMLLIASSECYLGTSLHGCITAFSFEVKFIPLNSKVKKLKNYLNTWWGSFLPYIVDYENLSTYLENDYKDYNLSLLQKSLINQKKIVYKAFNEMENFIKEQKKTSNDLGN